MSKGVQIASGATVIAVLLGAFALSNLEGAVSFTYYQDLAAFRAEAAARAGEPARVHGYVEPGTIERDVAAREVRFVIRADSPHAGGEADATLPVVLAGLETPDLFLDGAEVVVEGRLGDRPDGRDGRPDASGEGGRAADDVFRADRVMAKCPSKFAAAPEDAGEGRDAL